MAFLFVALGGALGAAGRYALSLIPVRSDFPFMTMITNIIGAVLIGFIAGIAAGKKDIPHNAVLFWKTGVCGGFTTFSTFSLEAFDLIDNRHYGIGAAYIILSCAFCIIGIFCGKSSLHLWDDYLVRD